MNSFIKYIPKSLDDHKAFVEHLLSIIDTKLQYVKHRTNKLIASYESSAVYENEIDGFLIDSIKLPTEQEEIFSLIETYSKTTKLLLLLRTKLNQQNVSLVYDLLNNDRYLMYDSKDLGQMLK